MANKIHFNLFIFSLHLLWTLSYISSILDSIHHMAVLTTFRLLASWRGCNNTFARVQQATYHLPSSLPNMLKWCLSVHTCSLVQSGTTVPQRANQHFRWLSLWWPLTSVCLLRDGFVHQWLILWPQFMRSSTMAFFFLLLFFAARPFSSLHGRNLSSNSRLSNKHMASCPWCYQAYLSMTLKEKKGATAPWE